MRIEQSMALSFIVLLLCGVACVAGRDDAVIAVSKSDKANEKDEADLWEGEEPRISLDVQNAPVLDVIKAICDTVGLGYCIGTNEVILFRSESAAQTEKVEVSVEPKGEPRKAEAKEKEPAAAGEAQPVTITFTPWDGSKDYME